MSRWPALLALPIALAGTWFLGEPSASASCVGPTLTVAPTHAAAGDSVRIGGEWWQTDCDDVIANGVHVYKPKADVVRIYFVQAGSKSLLAATVAESKKKHFALTATVRIPPSATSGAATIEAVGKRAGTQSAPFTVTAAGPQLPFTGDRTAIELLLASACLLLGTALSWPSLLNVSKSP